MQCSTYSAARTQSCAQVRPNRPCLNLQGVDAAPQPQPQPQPQQRVMQRMCASDDGAVDIPVDIPGVEMSVPRGAEMSRAEPTVVPAPAASGSAAMTAEDWLAMPLPPAHGDSARPAAAFPSDLELGARSLSQVDDELDRIAAKHGKGRRRRLSSVGSVVRTLVAKRSAESSESEKRRCVRCRKMFAPASNTLDACAYHPGSQQYWWGGWAGSTRAEAAGSDPLNPVGKTDSRVACPRPRPRRCTG
jgi:hypothetical protein